VVLAAAGLLVAGVATTATARTAEPAAGADDWNRARSAHFTVYTDAGGEAARQAALNLEVLRDFLVQIAPTGRFEAEVPFHMYLFTDTDQLAPFLGGAGGIDSGVLAPTDEGVYGATVWAERGGASRFLSKQYIAWVLADNLPELPTWFHRGLIDFYSTFEIVGDEAHLGKVVQAHLDDLRFRTLSHLQRQARRSAEQAASATESGEETPPADGSAEEEEEEEIAEAEKAEEPETGPFLVFSEIGGQAAFHDGENGTEMVNSADWALVHYLLLGSDQLRSRVRPYLTAVAHGADPEATFRESFGMEEDELVRALEDYVLQDRHRFMRIPLTGEAALEVSVDTMSTADVHHRLGALRLHTGQPGDPAAMAAAEEHFQQALASDPGHAPARAGIADLAAKRGDLPRAIAGFQAAVEGRPDDALLHYRLGEVRLRSLGGRRPQGEGPQQTLKAAVAELRRAAELKPDFPAAWERLGYALTLAPEPSQEAVTALERAAELRPGRTDVVSNLLLARARIGDQAGVGEAMARLRELGADSATLARGREVELRLMLHQGQTLVRAERLDDAVAVFAQVMTETKDQALAEAAWKQLEFIGKVTQRNVYASLYQRASGLIDAGDPEAEEKVQELLAMARPGLQREAAEALAERLEGRE